MLNEPPGFVHVLGGPVPGRVDFCRRVVEITKSWHKGVMASVKHPPGEPLGRLTKLMRSNGPEFGSEVTHFKSLDDELPPCARIARKGCAGPMARCSCKADRWDHPLNTANWHAFGRQMT